MAIDHDRIGNEPFVRVNEAPDLPRYVLEDITRPGVNGRAFREMAIQAQPFPLPAVRDCASVNQARALYLAYRNMIRQVVTVRYRGETFANFLVLDVRLAGIQKFANAVGGVGSGSVWLGVEFVMVNLGVEVN